MVESLPCVLKALGMNFSAFTRHCVLAKSAVVKG
jgi:hypothetical protein